MKLLSFLAGAAHAQEWDQAPPELTIDATERASLKTGEVVIRQGHEERGSVGTAMALVDGTAEESWAAILDFENYVRFLPYITASWTESPGRGAKENALRWGLELTTKGRSVRVDGGNRLADLHALLHWLRLLNSFPRGLVCFNGTLRIAHARPQHLEAKVQSVAGIFDRLLQGHVGVDLSQQIVGLLDSNVAASGHLAQLLEHWWLCNSKMRYSVERL